MKEQPILGYDWEMGHEEIKLEIGTYYCLSGRHDWWSLLKNIRKNT